MSPIRYFCEKNEVPYTVIPQMEWLFILLYDQ